MGIPIDPADYAPAWRANWDDVRFDHAAVAAAVAALKAADAALGQAADHRANYASKANMSDPRPPGFVGPVALSPGGILASWTGPHRDTWKPAFDKSLTDTTAHRQHIADLIKTLNGAARAAQDEQATRVADRKRWHEEYAQGLKRMETDVARMRADGMQVTVV